MKKNLLITMSGGTTSVINATLAGIIRAAQKAGCIDRILAGYHGIKGVLAESLIDLTGLTENDLELLYYTPASGFIGTTRVKPLGEDELTRLAEVFAAHDVGYFVNIGGNGTIKQSVSISKRLGAEVSIAAVPKTVDNDLGDAEFEKVLYTPGFPSCAQYWRHKVWIMNQENLGAFSHDQVLITQTFGRKTGFLAGCARLGDIGRRIPLIILLPEDQRPLYEVLEYLKDTVTERSRAIVVLAEGYEIGDLGERYDLSGQVMYGTSRTTGVQLLVNHCADIGIQARGFVPGFDQRSDISFVSALDLHRAHSLGKETVERLAAGESNFLASIARRPGLPGEVEFVSVSFDETDDYSRVLRPEWISYGNFDVTDEYICYVEPLIGSEQAPMVGVTEKPAFARCLGPNVEKRLIPSSSDFDSKRSLAREAEIASRYEAYAYGNEK